MNVSLMGTLIVPHHILIDSELISLYVSYGRIETLSGFSNGVFLILISIFIVFEAIERL